MPSLISRLATNMSPCDYIDGRPTPTTSSFHRPPKKLNFHTELSVKYIEKSSRPIIRKQIYETFDRNEVTDYMLKEAASLFSESYGVWGTDPTGSQRMPKQGELRKARSSRVSNHQDRKSREAKQRLSTRPISTRKRRLLLRKGLNRGSSGRERVCLSVESQR